MSIEIHYLSVNFDEISCAAQDLARAGGGVMAAASEVLAGWDVVTDFYTGPGDWQLLGAMQPLDGQGLQFQDDTARVASALDTFAQSAAPLVKALKDLQRPVDMANSWVATGRDPVNQGGWEYDAALRMLPPCGIFCSYDEYVAAWSFYSGVDAQVTALEQRVQDLELACANAINDVSTVKYAGYGAGGYGAGQSVTAGASAEQAALLAARNVANGEGSPADMTTLAVFLNTFGGDPASMARFVTELGGASLAMLLVFLSSNRETKTLGDVRDAVGVATAWMDQHGDVGQATRLAQDLVGAGSPAAVAFLFADRAQTPMGAGFSLATAQAIDQYERVDGNGQWVFTDSDPASYWAYENAQLAGLATPVAGAMADPMGNVFSTLALYPQQNMRFWLGDTPGDGAVVADADQARAKYWLEDRGYYDSWEGVTASLAATQNPALIQASPNLSALMASSASVYLGHNVAFTDPLPDPYTYQPGTAVDDQARLNLIVLLAPYEPSFQSGPDYVSDKTVETPGLLTGGDGNHLLDVFQNPVHYYPLMNSVGLRTLVGTSFNSTSGQTAWAVILSNVSDAEIKQAIAIDGTNISALDDKLREIRGEYASSTGYLAGCGAFVSDTAAEAQDQDTRQWIAIGGDAATTPVDMVMAVADLPGGEVGGFVIAQGVDRIMGFGFDHLADQAAHAAADANKDNWASADDREQAVRDNWDEIAAADGVGPGTAAYPTGGTDNDNGSFAGGYSTGAQNGPGR